MTSSRLHAVLTGDLIDSRHLADRDLADAQREIRDGAVDFAEGTGHAIIGRPDFFRGDAWQLLLEDPRGALRLSLLLRARLRSRTPADTRIAIGIGSTRSINRRKISLSAGEAFEISGHALDSMSGYFDLTTALPHTASPAPGAKQWPVTALAVVAHLCSDLVRDWTARQAEIAAMALLHAEATHEQIGTLLPRPVTKQTVTGALRSAHYRALMEALRLFEDTDWTTLLGGKGK